MGSQRRISQRHNELPIPRQYTRGLSLGIVCLLLFGSSWTIWILARPLYWKLYADVLHRYEQDPNFVQSDGTLGSGKQWGVCMRTSPLYCTQLLHYVLFITWHMSA